MIFTDEHKQSTSYLEIIQPSKLIISKISKIRLSYKFLDHATDAIIEVTAKDLKEAFLVAADAVIDLTLDKNKVEEKEEREFTAQGKDLRYLLFSWLEEVTFVLITEGFAIRKIDIEIQQNNRLQDTC